MPKSLKNIKPFKQKTIAIKVHNGFVASPHTTNLRATVNPLADLEPYCAPQTDLLWKAVEEEPRPTLKPVLIRTPQRHPKKITPQKKSIRFSKPTLPSFKLPALRVPKINMPTIHLHHAKALMSFLVIGALLIAPIPALTFYENLQSQGGVLAGQGKDALATIAQGSTFLAAGNFIDASKQFNKTLQTLASLETQLKNLHSILPFVSHVTSLTEGAQEISIGLINLSKLLSEQNTTPSFKTPQDALHFIHNSFAVTTPRLQRAVEKFNTIQVAELPAAYQAPVTQLQTTATEALRSVQSLTEIHTVLSALFNQIHLRRYLLVFQNDAEIRPTGGFMGSIAFLDIANGAITKLEIPGGGPYDFQGSQKMYEKPPKPLSLVSKRWELQDANWSPDFSTSAQEILRLLEGAKGPTVDGVISINASLVESVLRSLPPIEVAQHGVVLDSANFIEVTQNKVEKEYDKTINKPKQFIADTAPELIKTLVEKKDPATLLPILLALSQGLMSKDIQLYMTEPSLQTMVRAAGLDGQIHSTAQDSDYLMVVNSNIGGGKTDRVIDQSTSHTTRIAEDGRAVVTVTVSRTHTGTEGTPFYGVPNINYMRVYVPQGATLMEAHGFSSPNEASFNAPEEWYAPNPLTHSLERTTVYDKKSGTAIYKDLNKTVFANWTHTKPGETTVVRLTYKLPFSTRVESKDTPTLRYTLYRQKQSGVRDASFTHTTILPTGWVADWHNEASTITDPTTDTVVALLASQH